MTATRIDLSSLSLDATDVTEFAAVNDLPNGSLNLRWPVADGVEMTYTSTGTFDVVTEPTRTYTRRTPVVLRLRPGKSFRAVATVTTEITGAEMIISTTYSPADRSRLARYLHPEVYARRSAMHSAYHRRRR